MQFYARFRDEVIAEPALVSEHVQQTREQVSPAFRKIFGREGPLRDDLPPDSREHARADGFVAGCTKIHHDETRHVGYGVWFLRESVRNIRRSVRRAAP